MSTPVVAAGAAALGFFMYVRRWQQCGFGGADLPVPVETHVRTEHAPATWSETVYLFREALRYVYQETLGRWHAIDLFFGLAYISRRESTDYPAADIGAAGHPVCQGLTRREAQDLLAELRTLRRLMLYCQGLRHHGAEAQRGHWATLLGTGESDVLYHSATAGLLRPAFAILRDRETRSIILCIRGTHSRPDMFTSLIGAVKPHHVVAPQGAVLGWSHLGMLAAARWVLSQTKYRLISALAQHPDYQLLVVGHSMGGGTAALLTMMVREKVPELSSARCYAIACPAVMTLELAAACSGAVTTLVHGNDIVPTFSIGSVDALREEVIRSSWFADFQRDTRQRLYRAITATMAGAATAGGATLAAGCSGAGRWTARNILAPAGRPFRSCSGAAGKRPQRGGKLGGAPAGAAAGGTGESEPLLLAGRKQQQQQQQQPLRGRGQLLAAPQGGAGGADGGAGAEADRSLQPSPSMLEDALQQCLAAVEAGELTQGDLLDVLAAPPATEPFHRGVAAAAATNGGGAGAGALPVSTSAGLGAGGGGGHAAGAGRLRAALGKRPVAPDKKDDDRGGAGGGGGAGAEGVGGGVDGAGGGQEAGSAPAVVTGQMPAAGKASAATLRRRGWTWQVLDTEEEAGGGAGASGSSWVLEGGGVAGHMVTYVGRTGRLVGQAAGSLLRGGGAMFQACAPPQQQQQEQGAFPRGAVGWLADLPGSPLSRVFSTSGGGGGGGGGGGAPDGGAHALGGPDCGGDQGSEEGDPDLEAAEQLEDDEADAHELDRPVVRESISAVVATVVTADTDAGERAARAEASAAEELMREAAGGGGGSGSEGRRAGPGGRRLRGASNESSSGAEDSDGGIVGSPADTGRGQRQGLSKSSPDLQGGSPWGDDNAAAARVPSPPHMSRQDHCPAGPTQRQGSLPTDGQPPGGCSPPKNEDPRMVRRQMYPAGRILHLMPAHVVRAAHGQPDDQQQQQQRPEGQQVRQPTPGARRSSVSGAGAGCDYMLLEVPRREVYGRLRLCRAMVRDHFLPGYLRGLDAVAARLEAQLAAGEHGGNSS